jgi:hypothetical protein
MKNTLRQMKRIVSVLLIFIIMIQHSGCVSSINITSAELPAPSKYAYIVHCQKSFYSLDNIVISNDTLSGKINNLVPAQTKYIVRIFPISDSFVKIDTNLILRVPLNGISNMNKIVNAPGKTVALVAGILGGGLMVLMIIALVEMDLGSIQI